MSVSTVIPTHVPAVGVAGDRQTSVATVVLVTGVNMRKASRIFKAADNADIVEIDGQQYKLNAAAGTALELSERGHSVYMVGGDDRNLGMITEHLMRPGTHAEVVDLLEREAVERLVADVDAFAKEGDRDVHLVHYAGVSESKIDLPKSTMFLDPWDTPPSAIPELVEANTVSWLHLLQALRPVFRRQQRSKVVVISAVAATRTGRLHGLDAIQKGACHAMARTLALDLSKERIYVTEVMPGMTDTGFYDGDETLAAVMLAASEYGYDYTEDTFPLFSARKVGQAVSFALETDAHVRELSLIPYGQWPHLGA